MSTELVAQVCRTIAAPEFRNKIEQALPPNVSVDRFTRTVLTAIQQNPGVLNGDRQAFYNSIIRAASDGLQPDGREGAIVIMGGKPSWMPMVAGIIKRLAGAGITIDAQVVYENDTFEQELGDEARIIHKAPKLGTPRGEPLGVYAIARTRDGMVFREVMDRDQVEQVRQASRAKDSGPWKQWWTEMARKTVIRRLAKRLPITDAAVAETIQRDDDLYDFDGARVDRTTGEIRERPAEPVADAGPRRPRALQAVTSMHASADHPGVTATAAPDATVSAGRVIDHEPAEDPRSPSPDADTADF